MSDVVNPIKYENGVCLVLNQLLLPTETEYRVRANVKEMYIAIKDMELRGAPLIGIAAAYGVYFAARDAKNSEFASWIKEVEAEGEYLISSRPTAVNLEWAVKHMIKFAYSLKALSISEIVKKMENEAIKIHFEDGEICKQIGVNALELIKPNMTLLTHCNAGILATSRYGTATSVMYVAKERGIPLKIYADETRPYLQGARLTAYELFESGLDVTLNCDNMAGFLMSQGKIDLVITGADRIAANGDTANKIGTLSLAILCKHFGIPFYIAAPLSTIDVATPTGKEIVIEERSSLEVTHWYGKQIAPTGVKVYNPAFDVTPSDLIHGIITEKGIIRAEYVKNIAKVFE